MQSKAQRLEQRRCEPCSADRGGGEHDNDENRGGNFHQIPLIGRNECRSAHQLCALNRFSPSARSAIRSLGSSRPMWRRTAGRSEEHTSELQSLMRTSYAVFCLNKKKNINQ